MFIGGDSLYTCHTCIFFNVFFSDHKVIVTEMYNVSISDGPTTSRGTYYE